MKLSANLFLLTLLLMCINVSVHSQTEKSNEVIQKKQTFVEAPYKLFSTENYWTFIKLDTRNGKMWQVNFSLKEKGIELEINSIPLVGREEEVNGRFTLYPTKNMYNFLLLDQINGYVYQVQWSMDKENRGIYYLLTK